MWGRIRALVIKELLALLKDKTSRLMLIGPPLFQLLIFSYAATFDLNQVPYAVYNQDRGTASRELLASFQGSPAFKLKATLDHLGQVAPAIDKREVLLVINIPPDFSRQLLRGKPGDLQVLIDGRNSNTAMVLLSYVRTIVTTFSAKWAADHGWPSPPAELKVRTWFNPNLESRWFIVPGIVGLLTLVVALVVTALTVARERENGTFDQLLVTPLHPAEILLGKALPGILIGLAEGSIIILVAVKAFEVPLLGSLGALYLGMGLFILSAVGVGLMISSIAVTQQQALLGAFLFLVPAVILSGFATPIANMPVLVQKFTLLNPLRYFLVIIRSVFLEGADLELLLPLYWPMAVIGVVTLIIAGWLFRRRLY
ncbi:MAG: ABC transporter permease [Desulfarculaceae bacterium]|nr:ABC transporter permease [Desulfarculaceae bacterium]MCF8072871.1 ABC transporter permease [Desulfarculaceae bacterium]MCF8101039.1 ABC transporter permease [Desulfarculaceae bacterium]MCF8115574.1 ABC transporter permease [Desulfarculaceae bacterium]